MIFIHSHGARPMLQLNSRAQTLMMRHLSALLLVVLAGCGLADYQRQMDAQRRRIQEIDDTNNLLDDPIEIPMIESEDKKQTPAWLLDFYLRLPKGCGVMPKDPTPYPASFPFFRYGTSSGHNYFVCAAVLLEPKSQAEYDKYPMKDFRTYVVQGIEAYYSKTYKSTITFPPLEKATSSREYVKPFMLVTPPSGALEPIGYDKFSFSDANQKGVKEHFIFRVYFHEERGKQIAIVAQRPLQMSDENKASFDKSLEACLSTLDMSADTPSRRQQFKERRR